MIVEYSKSFGNALKKQSGKILHSIAAVMEEVRLASSVEDLTDCKKMVGYDTVYRLRIGNLRAFFVLQLMVEEGKEHTVLFAYLISRGEAYSKKIEQQLRLKDK